jgi:uroporphyrinogen-III synthase
MLPVIITRAQPGANETAARVSDLGHMPLISPALELVGDNTAPIPADAGIDSYIFTSANGVRFFARRSDARTKIAWCVGPATAAAARDADFGDVRESAGNAVDLAQFIAAQGHQSRRPMLHVANAAAKGDLALTLEELGFATVFAPLYRADTAAALSPAVVKTLAANIPALVLVHSAKGAAAFAQLAADLPTDHLSAVAISVQAAQPLMKLGVGEIHIARAPNEDGLFTALRPAAATLSA